MISRLMLWESHEDGSFINKQDEAIAWLNKQIAYHDKYSIKLAGRDASWNKQYGYHMGKIDAYQQILELLDHQYEGVHLLWGKS